MTFLEALKTGRPMRRKASSAGWINPWLYLGRFPGVLGKPCWHNIETGEAITFCRFEYLAEDWEVMP